jgi:hypothetical protein
MAGELVPGEQVLTKNGEAAVASKVKLDGVHTVYNLEVRELHNFLVSDDGVVVHNAYIINKCLNDLLGVLKSKAKYINDGRGKYKDVGGHHPLAKSAFEGNFPDQQAFNNYRDNALSIPSSTLDNITGITNVHNFITGQQNNLYSAWKNANPGKTMSLKDMADIEIKAMTNVGVPEDIATGWVLKGLERLKEQGVSQITNIPWNGVNP